MSALLCYSPKIRLAEPPHWRGARGWWLLLVLGLLSLVTHAQQRPSLRLDLLSNGPDTDQTYVYFEQGATTDFDPNFDATKLPNSSGLNLASFKTAGQQLAINGLPPSLLSTSFKIALFVGVPADGTYTVQVGQFDAFTAATVYLTDALLDVTIPLTLGTTYSFDLTAANTDNTYATSTRFALLFQPATVPLPVTLTSFTVVAQAPGVLVGWVTASEQHSARFEVERSTDGLAFTRIGQLAAAGVSTTAQTYQLLDNALPAGAPVLYYRLRQVDLDGTATYSPVRAVALVAIPLRVGLFPNPTTSMATLTGATPGTVVEVLDALGREVLVTTADANSQAILRLPAGLASGVYVVRAGATAFRLSVE